MTDPYRSLLLVLLPLVGCPMPPTDKETGDTSDTSGPDTDTDTADTDSGTDTAREPVSEFGCYQLPTDVTACPAPADVPLNQITPATCGAEVVSVDGPGTVAECPYIGGFAPMEWCTYPITVIPPVEPCDYGRPLVIGGAPRLAKLARKDGWAAAPDAPAKPVADAAERVATWARVGLAEHASVASFSRFALELMSLGAPADLVADAHAAALDEVRHAKLAFGLASRYNGAPVGPGPLPMRELRIDGDLAALAASTAREGCIAETLSALQMAEAHDRATDPAEKAALAVIARDEGKHAMLAWRTVRWAIEVGGERVRMAVLVAFAEAPGATEGASGLLPADVARAVIERGWREVITPTADALLDARVDLAMA